MFFLHNEYYKTVVYFKMNYILQKNQKITSAFLIKSSTGRLIQNTNEQIKLSLLFKNLINI